jgi:outer membrane protein OmpA-like peptidoglycan-associated protein
MARFRRTFSVMLLMSVVAVPAAAYAQNPSGVPAAPAPATAAAPAPAAPAPAAPAPAAPATAAAPAANARPRFLVYFNEFSAYLSPRAKVIIAKAAKEAKATGAKSITVQARASATGTVQTNKYLAMTRASIVADELEADGIEPAMVQQEPIGQTGSRDPSVFNRRVDVILHH